MILYLSATGNTLSAARHLAKATGDRLVDAIALMADTDRRHEQPTVRLLPGESLGILFPVHAWRPPQLLRRLFATMRMEGHTADTYTYLLCTAGDTVGDALLMAAADLRRRGITVSALFALQMPNTYVGLPFMDVDTPDVQQHKLQAAPAALDDIALSIKEHRPADRYPLRGRWPRTNTRLLGALFSRLLLSDKPFHVKHQLCTRCGQCARACPIGNIEWTPAHEPRWQRNHRCMACMACYHKCPHRAIRYGIATIKSGQFKSTRS